MRSTFLILLALAISTALPSCNGSKAFVKRAAKMEAAAPKRRLYYTAVMKKPTNIDAMVGLRVRARWSRASTSPSSTRLWPTTTANRPERPGQGRRLGQEIVRSGADCF